MKNFHQLVRELHQDRRGAVSLEVILIIGAIVLPILTYILKFGWPTIRDYFNNGIEVLEIESNNVTSGQ